MCGSCVTVTVQHLGGSETTPAQADTGGPIYLSIYIISIIIIIYVYVYIIYVYVYIYIYIYTHVSLSLLGGLGPLGAGRRPVVHRTVRHRLIVQYNM